jgi:ribonuclease HI
VEGINELIPDEFLERRSYERTTLPKIQESLKGEVIIQDEEQALEEAKRRRDGLVLWTDGSRREDEWVRCAVGWEKEKRWEKRRVHLGRQKEAFNAEVYAVSEAVKIADEICKKEGARRVMIFMDSQSTLQRIQSDQPGPGQVLALRTMRWESELLRKNIRVEYRWVPAHKGMEGNQQADQQAIKSAYTHREQYTETQNPLPYLNYIFFAHVSRRLTETKWEESKEEIIQMGNKSKHSYRYDLIKRGGNKAVMSSQKSIVSRFYQLKSGLALIAKYLRWIGKRRDMKCWWRGHEYQTRDHLFKWCKRWKREQMPLWVDGQEGEDGYEGVERVMKKPKISLPMSLVFAEEKCTQALLDFLSITDVGRICGVVEQAENSDHEELSDGGV